MGQDGEVVDVYVQAKRDGAAARRFQKRLSGSNGEQPTKILTEKLRGYSSDHSGLNELTCQNHSLMCATFIAGDLTYFAAAYRPCIEPASILLLVEPE